MELESEPFPLFCVLDTMILRRSLLSWLLAALSIVLFHFLFGAFDLIYPSYAPRPPSGPIILQVIHIVLLAVAFAALALVPSLFLAVVVLRRERYIGRFLYIFPVLITGIVLFSLMFGGLGEALSTFSGARNLRSRCGCSEPGTAEAIRDTLHDLKPAMTRADILKVAHGAFEECYCAEINHWGDGGKSCTTYFFDGMQSMSIRHGSLGALLCLPVCYNHSGVLTTGIKVNFLSNEGKLTDVIERLKPRYNTFDAGSCPM